MRRQPMEQRVSEIAPPRRARAAPATCPVRDCEGSVVGGEVMCRGCWNRLSWASRNAAGGSWKPPAAVSPGWMRDALSELGKLRSLKGPLSPEELRFRPEALRILATHEYARPDFETCTGGQHPCPWVSCPQHLYLTRMPGGTVRINHPGKDVDELEETCAQDVIRKSKPFLDEHGTPQVDSGISAEKVGELLGVKRGRVGQVVRKWKRAWRRRLSAQPG